MLRPANVRCAQKRDTLTANVIVMGRKDVGRGTCHVKSARVKSVACHVFSSTEEKSYSPWGDWSRFSSRREKRVERSSSAREGDRERSIREIALEVVYLTIVSCVNNAPVKREYFIR